MDGEKKKLRLSFGYLILGLWAVLLVQQVLSAYLRPNRISYSDFKIAVAQNKVEEIAIGKTLDPGTHEGTRGRRAGGGAPSSRRRKRRPSAAARQGRSAAAGHAAGAQAGRADHAPTARAAAAPRSRPCASTIRIC